MRRKLFHKFSLYVIAGLLLPSPSFSLTVNVSPGKVIPGDVFLIKIQSPAPDSVEAEFLGKKIYFYRTDEDEAIALVPVDITTPPRQYAILFRNGDAAQDASISVLPHSFKTIELSLPEEKVTLSPENQNRAAKEDRLLKQIWSGNNSKMWYGEFMNPTDTDISTEFGVTRIMNKIKTSVHKGMDFRGKRGTPVRAINSGKAILTQDLFFGGNTLIIDHGMGLYSVYMHLSKFNVSKGDIISREQVIAFVGSSGRATGPHLHISVKLNGVSVNPASLLNLEL